MTASADAPTTQRYRELDALRGFAALGVVLWHYRAAYGATPLGAILAPFYAAGFCMVDFFFVLSGVVLAKAYLGKPDRRNLRNNLVRRLARIYPLHLVTLLAAALLQLTLVGLMHQPAFMQTINDPYHFVLNLALSNYIGLQRGLSFNAPSWSISTEIYANLIFFLLLRTRLRLAPIFAALVVLSAVLLATFANGRIDSNWTIPFLQVHLVRTVLGFFTGVLVYMWVFEKAPRIGGWLADVIFVGALALMIMGSTGLLGQVGYSQMATVLVGFPLLIIMAVHGRFVRSFLRLRPFTYLGDISYSLYLIHFPMQILLQILVEADIMAPDFDRPATLLIFLIACIGVADISHQYLETPAQTRINAWWRRRSDPVER